MPRVAPVSEDGYNKKGEWVVYFEKLNSKTGNESFNGTHKKIILSFLASVHWNGFRTNADYHPSPSIYAKSH